MENTFTSEDEPKHVYTWYSYGEKSVRQKLCTAKNLAAKIPMAKIPTTKIPSADLAI